ncbi:hypothetical protein B0187_09565 [Haemophilus paracuniculus]|uniref:UPF0231 protein B0187_09565 n=1 Tax=Haemophilus paracuniculus TaxID=734 RepID=A0A1T0AQ27_9PAST|nr:YacL family protein [Haemophilus paracuniculus]OOR98178.1 hypothetical protein B0187_09565 [Haemophilus paracuniculus]
MEYQFTHTMHGVMTKCSMDHEAFARWINTEISENPIQLATIFEKIALCKKSTASDYEWIFEGREYSLYLNADEVMVKANHLEDVFDEESLEEGFSFYDQESIAFCGLEDFEAFLTAYQKFSQTYH